MHGGKSAQARGGEIRLCGIRDSARVTAMSEEASDAVIWKGGPSQWTNLWTYVLCMLLAAVIVAGGVFMPPVLVGLVLPLGWAGWAFLVVRSEVYELSEERLRFYTGVFSRKIDEIELYRVKDSSVLQPFSLRIFGLGNVMIETSDRSHPHTELGAVKDPIAVREHLRKRVERIRDLKRVREVDFDGSGDGDGFETT
jgi:uncharacterized membrane protein YdbT with pleckstrin-like domain